MLESVYIIFENNYPEEVVADEDVAKELCRTRNIEEEAEDPYTLRSPIWSTREVIFDSSDFVRVYRCSNCNELRPWCDGAADDHPTWCDKCWAEEKEKPWWWRKLAKFFRVGGHSCGECRRIGLPPGAE